MHNPTIQKLSFKAVKVPLTELTMAGFYTYRRPIFN